MQLVIYQNNDEIGRISVRDLSISGKREKMKQLRTLARRYSFDYEARFTPINGFEELPDPIIELLQVFNHHLYGIVKAAQELGLKAKISDITLTLSSPGDVDFSK